MELRTEPNPALNSAGHPSMAATSADAALQRFACSRTPRRTFVWVSHAACHGGCLLAGRYAALT